MERRKFTREFKLEAVKLITERGVKVAQASQDLGVHPTQLRTIGGFPYANEASEVTEIFDRAPASRL